MSALVFDVEGNGFIDELSELHCVVTCDLEEECLKAYHNTNLYPKHGTLEEGLRSLEEADCIIGHNITGYDLAAINKIHPDVGIYDPSLIDTQKLAELLFPEIKKQSIENWVAILKLPDQKIQIKDFSVLTQALLNRCIGDVKNNLAIYKYLVSRKRDQEKDGSSFYKALMTEQEVALIHSDQVQHGVWYDVDLAKKTADDFIERMNSIQEKVSAQAPPIMNLPSLSAERTKVLRLSSTNPNFKEHLQGVSPFKNLPWNQGAIVNPFVKGGKLSSQTRSYFEERSPSVLGPYCKVTFDIQLIYNTNTISYFGEEYVRKVKGPYNKVEFTPLSCSSDSQVKDFLLSIGWMPIEYNFSKTTNERTSPKLTEESFVSLPPGLGQDIAEYRILQHRCGLIYNQNDPENKGALSKVRPDHRVAAEAFTCGTPTARYRHSGAVCNIPRPSSKYGNEIRRLYGVAPGHIQVGIDLSGIEARMLTHFCFMFEGGEEFAKLVLEGDWHSANALLWGCTRDEAKTELYALMYGAGPAKLGATLGQSKAIGKKNKDNFMKKYKCYHQLVQALEKEFEKNGGFIYGLDGRKFYVRSKKDVLNTLLQGNSAIIFKNWMIEVNRLRMEFIRKHNVELRQIIAYHDELQFELYSDNTELAEEWGKIVIDAAKRIGRMFQLNVPLGAESKQGHNWSDCH